MKKLFVIFSVIWLSVAALSSGTAALAVSNPYAVIGEDVWLLADNGGKLFLLPRTYYAQINRMDDGFYYVTFNGVEGKIPKASVSVVGYDKTVRDTRRIIKIANEYSVFTEIRLKTSLEDASAQYVTVPTDEPLNYLGTYKQGESVWYYVSGGDKYGYVLNIYTDSPEISVQEFSPESDSPSEEPPSDGGQEKDDEPDLVKIIVISAVCAVVLIFVLILFIPRKNKKHKYYYS